MTDYFPRVIDIELSNRCNLDCVMCPRLPQELHLGDMERALLDKLLDECLAHSPRLFKLHGVGEPLLSPSFEHAVKRIKWHDTDHSIDLVTNGHLLNRDKRRFILGCGVDRVMVSVNAATAETYRHVRQSESFDKVVQNTLRLIDERDAKSSPTRIDVQIIRVPPADGEVEQFVDFWGQFDVGIEVWHDLSRGRRVLGETPSLDFEPCEELYQYAAICWDGRVGICCIDSTRFYVTGNITDQTLAEVYNGAPMQQIRAVHESGRTEMMPMCVDCSYRDKAFIAFQRNVSREGHTPEELPRAPALKVLNPTL